MTDETDVPNIPDCLVKEESNVVVPELKHEKDDTYWKFLDALEAMMMSFLADARAGDINKSAALRARKASTPLRKSLKEFREISTAHDKTYGRKYNRCELAQEIENLGC